MAKAYVNKLLWNVFEAQDLLKLILQGVWAGPSYGIATVAEDLSYVENGTFSWHINLDTC